MINHIMQQCVRENLPNTHFITLLCDMVDLPDFYLFNQASFDPMVHVFCPSAESAQQAAALGYKDEQINKISGIPISEAFYQARKLDKRATRIENKLDPDLPTIMVSFGGNGSQEIIQVIRKLEKLSQVCQIVAICGHNKKVADRLRKTHFRNAVIAVEFTRELPMWMAMSDIYIGKPGTSIYQAAIMRLPVICTLNKHTMLQERGNAELMAQQGIGLLVSDIEELTAAAESLLSPQNYLHFLNNLAQHSNEGLFDAAASLQKIIGQ